MHHNPAKNVLFVRASFEEISKRMDLPAESVACFVEIGQRKNVCRTAETAYTLRG